MMMKNFASRNNFMQLFLFAYLIKSFFFPVCKMSFERFDEARNSYGTDEDLIFVAAVNEE